MKLSVIVPVYNEAPHLRQVFQLLLASPCPIEREWIVVDDCSTDGSTEILKEVAAQSSLKLIELPFNSGKGAAIREGLKKATGDFVLVQDADFEYDPRDVPALLEPLLHNQADVVYGSRFKKSATQVHRTYHYFINRFLTILSNFFSGIYLTDMETCYKVFRSDLIQTMNLTTNRFGIEIELTANIAKTSARISEIPIRYYPRTRLNGKKITWKDGVAALWHIVWFNLFRSISESFDDLPTQYEPGSARLPQLEET